MSSEPMEHVSATTSANTIINKRKVINMESVHKYRDEFTGKLYDTPADAIAAEKVSKDIIDAFSFYNPIETECDFLNGRWCIQRTEEFYNRMIDTLIDMIERHEPWIAEQYMTKGTPLSRVLVRGYSFVGRLLDDNNSPLHKWWCIQSNICPTCFREYGQLYYALQCAHDDTIPTR